MQNDLFVKFVKDTFVDVRDGFVPLHDPRFFGNERRYLNEVMDSNFVSSVGEFVSRFEKECSDYTGAKFAITTVNGTAALHIALLLAGVEPGDDVITQPVTFVATCNAITYAGAKPVFVDVNTATMGMCPNALEEFLKKHTELREVNGRRCCFNKLSGARIAAVVPMHTFGHPCLIEDITWICDQNGICLVEDAAESLGSFYKGKHTGTFGKIGVLSFNGNKILTTGGGGMILTDDEALAKRAKHITTTGKVPHPWAFNHDCVAYNYRMTNLAAALGCGQIEQIATLLKSKRDTATKYADFFKRNNVNFFTEPKDASSNYWLNAILLDSIEERDDFLKFTNDHGVMTRPIWTLMNKLPMYKDCVNGGLPTSTWLEERVVNIPSSTIIPGYYNR